MACGYFFLAFLRGTVYLFADVSLPCDIVYLLLVQGDSDHLCSSADFISKRIL